MPSQGEGEDMYENSVQTKMVIHETYFCFMIANPFFHFNDDKEEDNDNK